eukprot:1016471-Pelagomonas_calceolata.AAC.1
MKAVPFSQLARTSKLHYHPVPPGTTFSLTGTFKPQAVRAGCPQFFPQAGDCKCANLRLLE